MSVSNSGYTPPTGWRHEEDCYAYEVVRETEDEREITLFLCHRIQHEQDPSRTRLVKSTPITTETYALDSFTPDNRLLDTTDVPPGPEAEAGIYPLHL